jgi:hypothetical protein
LKPFFCFQKPHIDLTIFVDSITCLIDYIIIFAPLKTILMKKTTILFTLLLFVSTVFISNQLKAQSCQQYWNKTAGGNDEDFGQALATDASGNLYAIGNFYSSSIKFGTVTLKNQPYLASNNASEMFLVKYDSCGIVQWAKAAGGNDGSTIAKAIATDAAGNIYVTGYFQTDTVTFGTIKLFNSSNRAAFIVKYDAGGNALWAIQGSGNGDNIAESIAVDASNNVYVSGEFTSSILTFGSGSVKNGSGGNANDVFIVKYDNSGNFQWLRSSNDGNSSGGGLTDAYGYGIGVDAAGNVYVGGTFSADYIRFGSDSLAISNGAENDIFVVKYNTTGTGQWLRTAGGGGDDEAFSLTADAVGNVYITGYINATTSFGTHAVTVNSYGTTAFIAKYDVNGTAQWAKGGTGDPNPNASSLNQGYHVTLDANNNPNIIGFYTSDSLKLGPVTLYNTSITNGSGGGDYLYDVFVASYKAATGSLSWARTAGGDSSDYGYGIAAGKTHGIFVTGEYSSPLFNIADTTLKHATASLPGTGDIFISNDIAMSSEQAVICQVTADSNSVNNIMIWDKTAFTDVAEFVIYRETSTNVYTKIGSQPFTALSQFVDTARSIVGNVNGVTGANGNPNAGAYRYKLQTLDTSGNFGQMSLYHNTVYFTQTTGTGTFNWNTYNVENSTTPVTTFNLEKDANNTNNWQPVASAVVTGNQTIVNDPGYTTGSTANYRVDPTGFNCTPTFRVANGNNSTDANKVKAHSNQSNNRVSGINKLAGVTYQVSVYPNPNNGSFTIESSSTEKQTLQVFDVNGKLVLSQTLSSKASVDASMLSEGVYNLTLIGNEGVANKKMVIVR